MSPEDQQKVAAAYRAWMDKKPDADKSVCDSATLNGKPMTSRVIMEFELASGEIYKTMDELLVENHMTLDKLLELKFGPQPRSDAKPLHKHRHFRI